MIVIDQIREIEKFKDFQEMKNKREKELREQQTLVLEKTFATFELPISHKTSITQKDLKEKEAKLKA